MKVVQPTGRLAELAAVRVHLTQSCVTLTQSCVTLTQARVHLTQVRDGKCFLAAATLRAETMYGQTNFWVLPEGDYGAYQMTDGEVRTLRRCKSCES